MSTKGLQVDCILTDPPYNISRKNNFTTMGRAGIHFGKWDINFNQKEWILLCAPLLKKGGSMIIFNDWKNLSYLVESLESSGLILKDLLRWEKTNPMPRNTNRRYITDFEFAIWAVKGGAKWTFNKPQNVSYLRPKFTHSLVNSGGGASKTRIHPTQKSLSLISEILLIHTNENDLVFDPFSGSATTALACLKYNRNFIGSELDSHYFKKAKQRILNALEMGDIC